MLAEAHKALHRRYFEELFNQGNLASADELVATNYVNHNPAPGETPGLAGLKQFVMTLRTAFPDIHFTLDDQLAEGDKIATRFTVTGTHQAEFTGVPATGKPIKVTAINIHRVADGKLQEGWLNADVLGMLQQLGAIPMLGQAAA